MLNENYNEGGKFKLLKTVKDTDHSQKENPSTHKNNFNFVSNKRNKYQSNLFTTGNIVVRVNKTLVNDTQC